MQKREFGKALGGITTKRRGQQPRVDIAQAAALPAEVRAGMVRYIVRHRGPVLRVLLGPETDMAWLQSCGYLYPYHSAGFDFLGTGEHRVGAEMRERTATARIAGTVTPSVMAA